MHISVLKKAINHNSDRIRKLLSLSFVVIFAGVGLLLLQNSRAAGPSAQLEIESAVLSGAAQIVSDASASAGSAIRFGGSEGTSQAIIPAAPTNCPTFSNGIVNFTPAGSPTRLVHIRMDSNPSTNGGPLIFGWHGLGTPDQTTAQGNSIFNNLFGSNFIDDYTVAEKGILVAPAMHTPSNWDNAQSWNNSNLDLALTDMIVACAVDQGLVDSSRIHTLGMSWGGYQTAHLGMLRSNYMASTVVMSGGFSNTDLNSITSSPIGKLQRPDNTFATMITHGGSTDLPSFNIVDDALRYLGYADSRGQFTILCNHNQGHIPMPDKDSVFEFLKLHTFGVGSAYPGALSAAYPGYCSK